jgi:Photoprotection regulator fluorescence recovery protein
MSSLPGPIPHPHQNEPTWSKSEKTIARTAFDAALGRELHEVIQEVKRMASEIQESSDLWGLENYLTERRKQIDRKYDYRYSQLTLVLGRLLYENRLREEDLRGLREDKMKSIRSLAKFLRESAA